MNVNHVIKLHAILHTFFMTNVFVMEKPDYIHVRLHCTCRSRIVLVIVSENRQLFMEETHHSLRNAWKISHCQQLENTTK